MDPSPFEDMPESERDRLAGAFAGWLAGLGGPAWVHVVVEEGVIGWEDLRAPYRAPRFYVEADPRDDPGLAGIPARPALPPGRPRPLRERPRAVLLEGGAWARVYLVYRLPPAVPEAFLARPDLVDEVHVHLEPLRGLGRLRARWRRIRPLASAGLLGEYWEALGALLAEAQAGHRLLRARILLVVQAGSPGELGGRGRALEAYLDGLGASWQLPARGQAALYALHPRAVAAVTPLVLSSAGAPALYPFVSEELSHPGGVFLGFNVRTGSPIVYNPYEMPNYNFVIIGETGSGKSMTGKVYVRRWWRRFAGPVFIIDPTGEYARVAARLAPGLGVHRVDPDRGGLDPVRLVGLGLLRLGEAYEILAEAYGLASRGERLQLLEALRGAGGMEDLLGVLGEAEVDMGLFRGEPPEVDPGRGAVFDLSGIAEDRLKVLAGSVLASILRPMLRRRSLLVVDEGWLWAQYPALMSLLAETARTGRKYGVNFLFITQRPADVLRNEAGRTILEQSSTVLLLRLNEASLEAIRGVYMLTESEARRILEARPGEGILRAGSWRLAVYIQPSRGELREFTTRPGEW